MDIENLSDEVVIKKSQQSCGDGNIQRLYLDEAAKRGIHDGRYAIDKYRASADKIGLVFSPNL
jgi:hypothetical protein